MSALGNDCPFFYTSSCKKGASCPDRHSEASKTSNVTCKYWESGRCTNKQCSYRHSYLMETESEVECYWEKQPSGCTRAKCPFKHTTRSQKEKVHSVTCTSHIQRKEEGASATITWSSSVQRSRYFELRFTEGTKKEATKTIITVRDVKGQKYTQTRLQHDTKYDVAVLVQGNPFAVSDCTGFSTPPGVPCDAFVFSSVIIHKDIGLEWDNKSISFREDKQKKEHVTSTKAFKKVQGACGTLMLRSVSQYWETNAIYHLRGVQKSRYMYSAAIGICANGKMDLVPNIELNRFFYGITYRKDEDGSSSICFVDGGIETMRNKMKCASKYNERIGFFFDHRQPQLAVIDVKMDCILHKTGKLNIFEGNQFEYYPVCVLQKEGDVHIKLLTGSDIKQFPSCLTDIL